MRMLYIATSKGHESVVKILLLGGANPSEVTANGNSAAMFACRGGHRAVLDTLRMQCGPAAFQVHTHVYKHAYEPAHEHAFKGRNRTKDTCLIWAAAEEGLSGSFLGKTSRSMPTAIAEGLRWFWRH